jgi:hypothetical protein
MGAASGSSSLFLKTDLRKMETVFTTGEAAKICKVSQQTIIRCLT